MNLLNKIEEIQKRPETFRKKVLIVVMGIIMIAVIAVWLSTIDISLDNNEKQQVASAPFAVFGDMIEDGIEISKDLIK